MSNITGTVRAKVSSGTNPTVYNVPMALANTEYSQVLSDSTKKILVRMRVPAKARLAFISGDTAVKWVTLEGGAIYFEDNLDLTGVTIYLRSTSAGQTAEILEWT